MLLHHLQSGDRGDVLVNRFGTRAATVWIAAIVIQCDAGCWPLVQLSDGQFTELRPFMSWRFTAGQSRIAA